MSKKIKQVSLDEFKLLAVCGGFSFADVLGAGRGWAEAILMNENVRTQFYEFFIDRLHHPYAPSCMLSFI